MTLVYRHVAVVEFHKVKMVARREIHVGLNM